MKYIITFWEVRHCSQFKVNGRFGRTLVTCRTRGRHIAEGNAFLYLCCENHKLHRILHIPTFNLTVKNLRGQRRIQATEQVKIMEVDSFRDIAPCSPHVNRRFGAKYHLQLQGRKSTQQETSMLACGLARSVSCSADFGPCKWRCYVPLKRRFIFWLHGAVLQKMAHFIMPLWGHQILQVENVFRYKFLTFNISPLSHLLS
jgi:hypothetical protein